MALAACALLHSSCGIFGGQKVRPAAPGTALEAFARELGVSVAVREDEPRDVPSDARVGRALSPELLNSYLAEAQAAVRRLRDAYGGAKPSLDLLPSAEDRVTSLARARGLIFDLDRQPEARALLDALLEEAPGHVAALELRAESHRKAGEFADATRIMRELVALFPRQARFQFLLARTLLENDGAAPVSGDGASARSQIERARAREAVLRGQREGERILASLATGALGVEACETLCRRLMRRFQPERAETVLRKAMRARPDDAELTFLLGRSLRYQGRFDEALGVFAPLAKSDPAQLGTLPFEARQEIVWCMRSLGRYADALAQLELLPESMRARRYLTQLRKSLLEERARGERVSYESAELRNFLRRSEDAAQRENALEILMQNAGAVAGVETDFFHVLRRDPVADLRARALLGLLRLGSWNERAITIALRDVEPRNRRIAILRARRLEASVATRLLFDALCREEDPETFRAAHDQLSASSEIPFFLVNGRADSVEGRAAVCDEWASKLGLSRRPRGAESGTESGDPGGPGEQSSERAPQQNPQQSSPQQGSKEQKT